MAEVPQPPPQNPALVLCGSDQVRGRETKVLLREAYREELPAEVLDRPKQGFGAPVEARLAGPLEALRRDSLPCPWLDAGLQKTARGQRLWTLLKWARVWKATC
jgi:asparagine synthase (glutamine-hydrolysing)